MTEDLHLRGIDFEAFVRLEKRAARNGRSVEAEHLQILYEALSSEPAPSFDALAAESRKRMAGRVHTPSEVLQRESRDER